jgi:hypothetical protein
MTLDLTPIVAARGFSMGPPLREPDGVPKQQLRLPLRPSSLGTVARFLPLKEREIERGPAAF